MRNRGWQGSPPANDTEARDRIVDAAMRCIDRHGPTKTGLSDVATELGVTRQTVYRLFPSTDDMFQAVVVAASDTFLDRLVANVHGVADPAEVLMECLVFTIERFSQERYLSLVLTRGPRKPGQQGFTSSVPSDLTRALLARLPVDWKALGLKQRDTDELVEIYLRTLESFIIDPGRSRTSNELRRFLRTWFVPAIDQHTKSDVS